MTLDQSEVRVGLLGAIAVAALATLPLFSQGYYLSLGVNLMLYAALCTAWTLFSGPTHYISLATAAFFGLGTYTVGLWVDHVPFFVLVLGGPRRGGSRRACRRGDVAAFGRLFRHLHAGPR